jgi:hypothetical protein
MVCSGCCWRQPAGAQVASDSPLVQAPVVWGGKVENFLLPLSNYTRQAFKKIVALGEFPG